MDDYEENAETAGSGDEENAWQLPLISVPSCQERIIFPAKKNASWLLVIEK